MNEVSDDLLLVFNVHPELDFTYDIFYTIDSII